MSQIFLSKYSEYVMDHPVSPEVNKNMLVAYTPISKASSTLTEANVPAAFSSYMQNINDGRKASIL